MLEYLHVKNLALIEECELSFSKGLNILTGETGAGKSILMGSVNLALGAKADSDIIRSGADEALVELVFLVNSEVNSYLEDKDLPIDGESVIISRKISPTKSIFKINGETVTAKQVKELAELVIDVHGQHEHQSLLNCVNQRNIIDAYAGNSAKECKDELKILCETYKRAQANLDELTEKTEGKEREISLLEYEIGEIENGALRIGEDDELEERYKTLSYQTRLTDAVSEAVSLVSSDGGNDVGTLLSKAIQRLNQAVSLDSNADGMLCKLTDAESLLGDFAIEASDYLDEIAGKPGELEEISQRLDVINGLKARFGKTIEQVLKYAEDKSEELRQLQNIDEVIEKLKAEVHEAKSKYDLVAGKLSDIRKKAAEDFSGELRNALLELNFLGAEFSVEITASDTISQNGTDLIEFMISTNPGEPKRPLRNVASGGELSRIMLAIKTIMAERDSIDSLIFDEIDTGISGKTAWEVAKKLGRLSKAHQVISITHLPQIAAMADRHFEIAKSAEDGVTRTCIDSLDADGEIREIARLLGADVINDAALNNARELKMTAHRM